MTPEPERLEILSVHTPAVTPAFSVCTTYWLDDRPIVDGSGRVAIRIRSTVELVRAPAVVEVRA